MICATSKTSDQPVHTRSLIRGFVKLLTEHHLEFLSLKVGYKGSSESTHVKIPHCWKSHVTARLFFRINHNIKKSDVENLRNLFLFH